MPFTKTTPVNLFKRRHRFFSQPVELVNLYAYTRETPERKVRPKRMPGLHPHGHTCLHTSMPWGLRSSITSDQTRVCISDSLTRANSKRNMCKYCLFHMQARVPPAERGDFKCDSVSGTNRGPCLQLSSLNVRQD